MKREALRKIQQIFFPALLLVILPFFVFGQSFQRMAIAKGSYKLGARSSSKVTAYCLDFSRKAPTRGMDYANILSGSTKAVVEITNAAGSVSRIPLTEAIDKNYLALEGMNPLDGQGKEVIQNMIDFGGGTSAEIRQLKQMVEEWDKLPIEEQRLIEDELATMLGLQDEGNHQALQFVNKTDYTLEIKLESNLQVGTGNESNALKGVDDIQLSSKAELQGENQDKLWELREQENLEKLKTLGFYDGQTAVSKAEFEKAKKVYQNFQESHKLTIADENIGVFDQITETRVNQELDKLSRSLADVGFEGNIEEAIKTYQRFKGFPADGYFTPDLHKALKEDVDAGIYRSADGKIYNTVYLKMPNGKERFFELETGFHVRFRNSSRLEEINQVLESRFYLQEEIEVISLVNDAATTEVLKKNFPNNHLEFNLNSMQDFLQKLKKNKRKSVFILGHIENDAFVTQLENGKKFSLPLKNIHRLMEELDINIFPLGCNSGQYTTGMGNKFNSIDALNQLKPAVENNTTFKGMLQDLAGPELKVIIDDNLLEDRGYMVAKIARQQTQAGIATVSGIGAGAGLIMYFSSKKGDSEEEEKDSEPSGQNN